MKEKNAIKDIRIKQLEMKVSETEKLIGSAPPSATSTAPITPPESPPTLKSVVPTIELAKHRELQDMKKAVDISLQNEKDISKKSVQSCRWRWGWSPSFNRR